MIFTVYRELVIIDKILEQCRTLIVYLGPFGAVIRAEIGIILVHFLRILKQVEISNDFLLQLRILELPLFQRLIVIDFSLNSIFDMFDGIGIFLLLILSDDIRTLLIPCRDYGHRLIIRIVWAIILLSVTAASSTNDEHQTNDRCKYRLTHVSYIGNHKSPLNSLFFL